MIEQRPRIGGWALAAAAAVIGLGLYEVRVALLPFVFAAAIGFIADALIQRVQRRMKWRRWVISVILYLILLAFIGMAAYWGGRAAVKDISNFIAQAPGILEKLLTAVMGPGPIDVFGKQFTPQSLTQTIYAAIAASFGGGLVTTAAQYAFGAIFAIVLTLVLIPYFMISGPRLAAGVVWLLPPERRNSFETYLHRITPVLRRYFVGLLCVVTYTIVMAYIGFGVVFGLPHSALLSIAVGLLELIPVVGPITSAVLVGVTALQEHGIGTIIGVAGWAIALRLSIDNVVGPLVLGEAVRVHPVVVIFCFTIGIILFGVVGLLLAVPVAACIRIGLDHYYSEPIAPH